MHRDDHLLVTSEVHIEQSHASRLAPLIDEVLRWSGIQATELDAIAVSAGPGSYTGLRIGVSTGKGLCYGLNIPMVAVNTLELLAFQMSRRTDYDTLLCPMIDARRMEVYCLMTDRQFNIVSPVEARIIDEMSFADELAQHQIVFFGNGAEKCSDVIQHPHARFISNVYPQASALGLIAGQRLKENRIEKLNEFEPMYVKGFVAKQARSIF